MGSRLLYRDGLMLIIDKPAGLAVHKGPKDSKGGASIEDYFDALRFGLPRPPALAHRLDKETSGCLVLGRHRKALADLNLMFRNGKVGKTYWAVVEGGPEADEGQIDMPLGRLDDTRGWWMKHDPAGLPSATSGRTTRRSARSRPAAGRTPCHRPQVSSDQSPGPKRSVSQLSSGVPELRAPTRSPAEPGASGGSVGALAPSVKAISFELPRP